MDRPTARPATSATPATSSSSKFGALVAGAAVLVATALAAGPALAADSADQSAETSNNSDGSDLRRKRLKGSVGPGYEISISDQSVKPGRYKLIVKDQGTIHNFHISGPGVDKSTSIPKTGKTVWKITLKEGHYAIVCDPHADLMVTHIDVA